MGKRYTRTKAQALELEANSILWAVVLRPVLSEESNSILWAVVLRPVLSEESKEPRYMPLYVCVKAMYW